MQAKVLHIDFTNRCNTSNEDKLSIKGSLDIIREYRSRPFYERVFHALRDNSIFNSYLDALDTVHSKSLRYNPRKDRLETLEM